MIFRDNSEFMFGYPVRLTSGRLLSGPTGAANAANRHTGKSMLRVEQSACRLPSALTAVFSSPWEHAPKLAAITCRESPRITPREISSRSTELGRLGSVAAAASNAAKRHQMRKDRAGTLGENTADRFKPLALAQALPDLGTRCRGIKATPWSLSHHSPPPPPASGAASARRRAFNQNLTK
jgi:hypothetical protein